MGKKLVCELESSVDWKLHNCSGSAILPQKQEKH